MTPSLPLSPQSFTLDPDPEMTPGRAVLFQTTCEEYGIDFVGIGWTEAGECRRLLEA